MIARILFLLCLLLPGTLSAQDKPEVPALEEPVTLTVWQRDIAVFRATLGSLTPNIRRENALQRISDLPKGALYDEVRTEKISVSGIQGVSFLSGKRLLFTLVEADADTDTGTTLAVTANEVLKNLEALRRARLEQRSLPLILRGAGISVIATLVFAGFLWGLGRLGTIIRGFFVRRAALVDLPGYGYAQVPLAVRLQWQGLLEHYLTCRSNLVGLVLIMDSRRPLTDLDWKMIGWCGPTGRPIHCLLTKSDKLTKQEQTRTLRETREALAKFGEQITVQMFSSLKKTGMEDVEKVVGSWLDSDGSVVSTS